jgi:hypothetical protein
MKIALNSILFYFGLNLCNKKHAHCLVEGCRTQLCILDQMQRSSSGEVMIVSTASQMKQM